MLLGPEFRWVLKGYTPETIPMTRLAEYMRELGRLLGHEASVHFVRLEKGSVAIVGRTDRPVVAGKVEARVDAVRRHEGPYDAVRAYENINDMLSEDGQSALLKRGSATIIRFPGAARKKKRWIEVDDFGSVSGYLYMLYEGKDGFQARLRLSGGAMLPCAASRAVLDDLKACLFHVVRVHGQGRWAREDGIWRAKSIYINKVETLGDSSLREVVDIIRGMQIEWPDDPLGYLNDLDESAGTIQ